MNHLLMLKKRCLSLLKPLCYHILTFGGSGGIQAIRRQWSDGHQQGAAGGPPQGPSVAELSNLLHQLMQQQAGRDLQMRQESQWQDSRWNQIQYGYSQIQREVYLEQQELQVLMEAAAAWPTPFAPTPETTDPANPVAQETAPSQVDDGQHSSLVRLHGCKSLKMQPYSEGEDNEHLMTFWNNCSCHSGLRMSRCFSWRHCWQEE